MLSTIIFIIVVSISMFTFIFWLDAFLNRQEEMASLQEWHNFRKALSNKGDK
jgi:hypothetical protein